jgi:hypothetical protein
MSSLSVQLIQAALGPDNKGKEEARLRLTDEALTGGVLLPTQCEVTATSSAEDIFHGLEMLTSDETVRPWIRAYTVEASERALEERDGHYAPLKLATCIALADVLRYDLELVDVDTSLLLEHEHLLQLRDLAALGGAAMEPGEKKALLTAALHFAADARRYCTEFPAIRSLRLALVSAPGSPDHLWGVIDADEPDHDVHAAALKVLSERHLRPGWRFTVRPQNSGAMIAQLVGNQRPRYEKGESWWQRWTADLRPLPRIELRVTD